MQALDCLTTTSPLRHIFFKKEQKPGKSSVFRSSGATDCKALQEGGARECYLLPEMDSFLFQGGKGWRSPYRAGSGSLALIAAIFVTSADKIANAKRRLNSCKREQIRRAQPRLREGNLQAVSTGCFMDR